MIAKVIIVPKHIGEKDFLEYMKRSHNLDGIKFNKSNLYKINNIMMKMDNYAFEFGNYQSVISSILKSLGKGSPDFLLYTTKNFLLCEFKSHNDSLSPTQILWFDLHSKLPLAIAIAGNPYNVQKNPEFIEEESRIIA